MQGGPSLHPARLRGRPQAEAGSQVRAGTAAMHAPTRLCCLPPLPLFCRVYLLPTGPCGFVGMGMVSLRMRSAVKRCWVWRHLSGIPALPSVCTPGLLHKDPVASGRHHRKAKMQRLQAASAPAVAHGRRRSQRPPISPISRAPMCAIIIIIFFFFFFCRSGAMAPCLTAACGLRATTGGTLRWGFWCAALARPRSDPGPQPCAHAAPEGVCTCCLGLAPGCGLKPAGLPSSCRCTFTSCPTTSTWAMPAPTTLPVPLTSELGMQLRAGP